MENRERERERELEPHEAMEAITEAFRRQIDGIDGSAGNPQQDAPDGRRRTAMDGDKAGAAAATEGAVEALEPIATKARAIANPESVWNRTKDDEPVFVLTGRDMLAPNVARFWSARVSSVAAEEIAKGELADRGITADEVAEVLARSEDRFEGWLTKLKLEDGPAGKLRRLRAKVAEARRVADEMAAWQRDHGAKLPD